MTVERGERLHIVHCFRSPVGGIFRHVRDLIAEQVAAGHHVGVICDNNTGGEFEEAMLAELEPSLALGLHRLAMDRAIGPRDLKIVWALYREMRTLDLDVLHAHGAKGGAYARMIGSLLRRTAKRPVRLYCPHGGSIHYDRRTLSGAVFFTLERVMERFTDRLVFVSDYERRGYLEKVGRANCPISLVHNGVSAEEFEPVATLPEATDLLYIGMMRDLKGVDLLLDALPIASARLGRRLSITLVGDGPDLARYKAHAAAHDPGADIVFLDPMAARDAFGLGRLMIVPSRAESLPYIVLEALAARRPLLATRVGGIPEIYGEHASALVPPDDAEALAKCIAETISGKRLLPDAQKLASRIEKRFSAVAMAAGMMQAYRETLGESDPTRP